MRARRSCGSGHGLRTRFDFSGEQFAEADVDALLLVSVMARGRRDVRVPQVATRGVDTVRRCHDCADFLPEFMGGFIRLAALGTQPVVQAIEGLFATVVSPYGVVPRRAITFEDERSRRVWLEFAQLAEDFLVNGYIARGRVRFQVQPFGFM